MHAYCYTHLADLGKELSGVGARVLHGPVQQEQVDRCVFRHNVESVSVFIGRQDLNPLLLQLAPDLLRMFSRLCVEKLSCTTYS
jgi:hypothetical protein